MQIARALFFSVLLGVLAGCAQQRELIVKTDGSGRIVARRMDPRGMYEKQPHREGDGLHLEPIRPTAESVAHDAANLGEGVELVSFKKIENNAEIGYEATYEFPDVTKLNADKIFFNSTGPAGADLSVPAQPRKFGFTKGEVCELTIPVRVVASEKPADPAAPPPQKLGEDQKKPKWSEVIPHINFCYAVRVEGAIQETNAAFRDGNEVVLLKFDGKGMAADPELAKILEAAGTMGDVKTADPRAVLPEKTKYFQLEEAETVTVRFK